MSKRGFEDIHEEEDVPQPKRVKRTVNAVKEEPEPDAQMEDSGRRSCMIGEGDIDEPWLERVVLENFMCHEHLVVELGRSLNFISGLNGSGKSAILTGIALCLGARTSSTGRGLHLGSVVRDGASMAVVQVRFANVGLSPYRQNEFGPSVVIERKILKGGTSSYALKTSKGNTVSTQKRDVTAYLDHINFQPDNPLAILTQELAKTFLHSSKPKEYFQFFMKATMLDKVKINLIDVQKSLEQLKITSGKCLERSKDLEDILKVKENEYKMAKELLEITKQVGELEDEFVWACVHVAQKNLDEHMLLVHKIEKKKPKFEEKYEESTNISTEAKNDLREIEDLINGFLASVDEAKAVRDKISKERRLLTAEIQRCCSEVSSRKRAIEGLNRQIQLETDRIEKEKRRAAQKDEHLSRIQSIEIEIDELEVDMRTLQETMTVKKDECQGLDNKRGDIRRQQQRRKNDLQILVRQVEDMQGNTQSNANRFHPMAHRILQEVNRRKRQFSGPVVGPIGSCISLKDAKWGAAVEHAISVPMLRAFVVTCAKDMKSLRNIFRDLRVRFPPNIVLFKGSMNVAYEGLRAPTKNFTTVLDVISFDEYPVMMHNALIDFSRIEQKGLFATSRQANQHITPDGSPANMSEGYIPDGTMLRSRFTSVQVKMYRAENFLTGTVQHYMDNMQLKKSEHEQELTQLQSELIAVDNERTQVFQEYQSAKNNMSLLQNKIMRLRDKHADLVAQLNLSSTQSDTRVHLKESIYDHEVEISRLEEEKVTYTEKSEAVYQEYLKAQKQLEDLEVVANSKSDVRRQRKEKVTEAENSRIHYRNELDKLINRIEASHRETEALTKKLQADIAKAEKFCSRIETERSPNELRDAIAAKKKAKAMVEQAKHGGKTFETIKKEYLLASKNFLDMRKQIENVEDTALRLKSAQKSGRAKFKNLRKSNMMQASTYFNQYMGMKNFSGCLKCNFEAEELHVLACTGASLAGKVQEGLRHLSGGERSYTTLSFVLALSEIMQMPILAMDEIDVFMDEMNRSALLHTVSIVSRKRPYYQMIVFTPHSLSEMKKPNGAKVFMLKPPRRCNQPLVTEFMVHQ
eukprot:Rmarinus@m.20828